MPEDLTATDGAPGVDRGPELLKDGSPEIHVTQLDEQGPFVVASCSCGWRSYARRSRPLARSEARDHELLHSSSAD